MKLLTYNYFFILQETEPAKIRAKTLAIIKDPVHMLMISYTSFWEMVLKDQAGNPMIQGLIRKI